MKDQNYEALTRVGVGLRHNELDDEMSQLIISISQQRNQLVTNLQNDFVKLDQRQQEMQKISVQQQFLNSCKNQRVVPRYFNYETVKANFYNLDQSFRLTQDVEEMGKTEALRLSAYSCQACFHLDDYENMVSSNPVM